jgi:hypothetical protein
MKKLAAVMVLGLLPLAGCVNPHGYPTGPYAAYDRDYDQGYDGYDQPYGQAIYGPDRGAYGGAYDPGYPNQGYYDRSYYGRPDYGRPYGPTYRPSRNASSYYGPPSSQPAPGYGPPPSSYYSTYYGCGCGR